MPRKNHSPISFDGGHPLDNLPGAMPAYRAALEALRLDSSDGDYDPSARARELEKDPEVSAYVLRNRVAERAKTLEKSEDALERKVGAFILDQLHERPNDAEAILDEAIAMLEEASSS